MNIAVFIDGDNIPSDDIKKIVNEIRNHGRIVIANVYGDWSETNMAKWMSVASVNGINNIQCDRISGKNSTDIKLMLDMLKMLFTNDFIECYFIVTSDSDYRHIVSEIKLKGKKCFCLGSERTNTSLQNICDKFIKIENLNKPSIPDNARPKTYINLDQKKYNTMFIDIRRLLETDELICMSKIKSEWEKKYQFDYREYNHTCFSSFLFHNYGSKLAKVSVGNGTSMVKLKENSP
jgi:uncharacterized protein (TIGR00288 family)